MNFFLLLPLLDNEPQFKLSIIHLLACLALSPLDCDILSSQIIKACFITHFREKKNNAHSDSNASRQHLCF